MVFNWHPFESYEGLFIESKQPGAYHCILSSDDELYGGHKRVTSESDY